jgi:hypothetical protein
MQEFEIGLIVLIIVGLIFLIRRQKKIERRIDNLIKKDKKMFFNITQTRCHWKRK